MKKKDFCGAQNISVIIPYAELEKLLQAANKIEQMEMTVRRINERYAAMGLQYSEILEKVAEIEKYL